MLKQVQHDVKPYTLVFQTFFPLLVRRYSSLITHYSLLITQSSLLKGVCQDGKPVRANSRGFLNPWNNDKIKIWRLQRREARRANSRVFQTFFVKIQRSLLITHCSSLIAQRRLSRREARRANSRGFSNPWNNDKSKKWRLQRRERAVRVAVPRLYRRH